MLNLDGAPSSRQKSRKGRAAAAAANDKEAKERELKEQRARELEREAERERERQREKEIRAFRDFSTKLPIKQTRRSRGSSFIMEQQQQQQQQQQLQDSNGKISGGGGPTQPSSLHPQFQLQSQQSSNMIAPILPWNSSGPMNGSFNSMPPGQGYGHLGPLTDPSQLKPSLAGPGQIAGAVGFEPLAYPGFVI